MLIRYSNVWDIMARFCDVRCVMEKDFHAYDMKAFMLSHREMTANVMRAIYRPNE